MCLQATRPIPVGPAPFEQNLTALPNIACCYKGSVCYLSDTSPYAFMFFVADKNTTPLLNVLPATCLYQFVLCLFVVPDAIWKCRYVSDHDLIVIINQMMRNFMWISKWAPSK